LVKTLRSPGVAQQVFFTQRDFTAGDLDSFSDDAWDNYVADRDSLRDHIATVGTSNPVILTGDVHANYLCDVKADFEDPQSATVATEIVGTSITTGGDGVENNAGDATQYAENPHIKFINRKRGYVRNVVTPDTWTVDYRIVDFVRTQGAPITTRASYVIENGVPGLFPGEACGYELTSFGAPIAMLSGSWTVPNLNHSPTPVDPVFFRTFFGLGFLDVHVEMTVDSAQNVTSLIRIHTGDQLALPVSPGDTINAVLCLQTNPAGTAFYFLANETTSQTVNFNIDTGFPPAVTINAGISRGRLGAPFNPLARFGTVYFDEIVAFTTNGTRFLTDGAATTMVDSSGATLAQPFRLNENAFKIVRRG
jgi:PhoD-like phosphatase/Peptidase A4 family